MLDVHDQPFRCCLCAHVQLPACSGDLHAVSLAAVCTRLEPLKPSHPTCSLQGRVKRIEKFGAFVALSAAELTGLVHLSELSDDFVKDPTQHLQIGQGEPACKAEPSLFLTVTSKLCGRTRIP